MSVFNPKKIKTETVESLHKQSQDIIGAFMTTATNLTSVNSKIQELRNTKLSQIESLEQENKNLLETQEANSRFVNNINSLLN